MTPTPGQDATEGPRTFAELLNGGPKTITCNRCGETATVRLQLAARPITGRRATPTVIASHRGELCEALAPYRSSPSFAVSSDDRSSPRK